MNELQQSKADALEARRKKRDQESQSILEAMGLIADNASIKPEPSEPMGAIGTDDTPDNCPICLGKGQIVGLFRKFECDACHGTGYDLSDPLRIIQWQKACMTWAKKRIKEQSRIINELKDTRTDAEKMADAVNATLDKCHFKN